MQDSEINSRVFDELAESDQFGLMAKQLLVVFKRYVFDQLDALEY